LNLLKGEEFDRENPLFWHFYRTSPEIAMRIGNFMILGKDNDTIPRSHQFSAPDMAYISEMNLMEYELYDLSEDIHQSISIFNEHPDAAMYKHMLNSKLEEIQMKGYDWDQLPPAKGRRKVKTEWVKY